MTATPLRMVCFPHAGAGMMTYYPWRSALAGRIEVRVVESPGRVGRPDDPPAGTVAELLSIVEQRAQPLLHPPYVLYGHSLGALLAFETARRLSAQGRAPALLVVSGRNAPTVPAAIAEIHKLPDEQFLQAVDQLDSSMPGLRSQPELAQLFLPTLRSDLTLAETYDYHDGPPLSCPILSIQGEDDPVVSRPGVAAWAAHTTGRCTFRWMPGEHLFHLAGGAGFLTQLSELMREALSSPA
ncbi:MAG TPA: alpha/beta fold hydrolase [Jatrophihabitans sp.]|jgi:surfactin synthase thioesterase subunit|uniref:thioesterase II family protein n=1 Tax=Jatrophihabitans sp. TaxID=1932789 RepID=UPI002F110A6C